MTVSINSITIPTDIRDTGSYVPLPYGTTVDNGLGETVTAGLPSITWTFPSLTKSQFTWFVTTLMAGAHFLKCPAVLMNDLDVEITYSSVIVRRPTYDKRQNGLYMNVVVKIDTMET